MALYSLQFPGEQLTEHKLFPNLERQARNEPTPSTHALLTRGY